MRLCEFANESIAFLDYRSENFFTIKGNRLVGAIGRIYDDLLVKPEKRKFVYASRSRNVLNRIRFNCSKI